MNAIPLRRTLPLAGALVLALAASPAAALYLRPDLEKIPVGKLVENLEQTIQKKPKDVQARLNLARLYAMAYAAKTDTVEVWKGKLNEGPWLGYEPKHVPFTPKAAETEAEKKAALENLEKAIDAYREVVKVAPDNLTARLGLAWTLDQAGQDEEAVKMYRQIIDDAWQKEMKMEVAPLGWHPVTAEAGGYLMAHLDKEGDAQEIAALQQKRQRLLRIPRPVTPIIVPLADRVPLCGLLEGQQTVRFDADGSGLRDEWTWITPKAAWLVYDHRGDGQITSAIQMFGNVTFWCFWDNGYQALAALDADLDGKLRGGELDGLALWHDRDGDGVSDPGEVRTLAEHGVVELSCAHRTDTGGDLAATSPGGVTFADGTVRPTYDVILHRK